MSTYPPAELETLRLAPQAIGLAVALVDVGIVSSFIESVALSEQIGGAAAKYPTNSIIQAAFSQPIADNSGKTSDLSNISTEEAEQGVVLERALNHVNTALAVVTGKASDTEITEYKQFIYDCGVAVAEAAGEGLFGRGNQKVSKGEAAALAKIKAALGV